MDGGLFWLSMLFGLVGMGMFSYGRKAGRFACCGAGMALMVVPYFIANLVVMLLVCGALSATPWIIRES